MKIIQDINYTSKENLAIGLGFFDGVHLGHKYIIDQVIKLADLDNIVPSIFTFKINNLLPEQKKNTLKLISDSEKLKIFKKLKVQNLFIPSFDVIKNLDPVYFLENILFKNLNAKIIVCGPDFNFGKDALGDINLLKQKCDEHGVKLFIFPFLCKNDVKISSSLIRDLIKEGNIVQANNILGYRHYINSKVIYGSRLGKQIGIPTINQKFENNIIIPKRGVYASFAHINEICYSSISNVGIRPTLNNDDAELLCETHIFNINENLYNNIVKVEFVSYIRKERKFATLGHLKDQINLDILEAIKICNNFSDDIDNIVL